MMSSDALIRSLSTDLAPVQRRRAGREAGMILLLVGLELALLAGFGLVRHDLGRVIVQPFMLWKLSGTIVLAGAGCAFAIRSFAPLSRPRRGLPAAAMLAAGVIVAGSLTGYDPVGSSLFHRLAPVHGIRCVTCIVILSLPIMATLAVLMRGAAPTRPEQSATASGFAAAASGAFVFAFACPMNDPLYVVVWYSIALASVITVSRWLLPRNFRL